jgi:hypothetical protein
MLREYLILWLFFLLGDNAGKGVLLCVVKKYSPAGGDIIGENEINPES